MYVFELGGHADKKGQTIPVHQHHGTTILLYWSDQHHV